jgi:ABC-2 type transport system permease protein
MNRVITKAKAFLLVYYAYMLEYRAELFLWALSGTLPLILMGVWTKASAQGQFGLNPGEFARYFLIVFLIRQFTVVWVIWEFEKEVVEGRLSPRLLQPIDPVWHHVASHLSERLARLPFALALVGLFFLLYPQAIWVPSLWRVLLFVPVLGASVCLALSDAVYVCDVCFLDRTSKCDRAILVFVLLISLWHDCATRSFSTLGA